MTGPSSPERWERVQRIFDQVVDLEPADRRFRLSELCSDDKALLDEVVSLLEAHDRADDVLRHVDELRGLPPVISDRSRSASYDPFGLCGKKVTHYEIERLLGSGGMGVVYEALDVRLQRKVALKFLPATLSEDEPSKTRFIHEAQAASALDHPNICTVHEIGETDEGQLFIAMARYAGETLKARIARTSLAVDEAVDYAVQIARGLSATHEAGIVHRDIKPANVMITPAAGTESSHVVRILDFGLAKMAHVQLTRSGNILGTVDYMSPEQATGEEVDHRTDVWSVGVLLYEMLAGVRPFQGANEQAVIYSILNRDPTPLAECVRDLHADLGHIVAMCLERDPDHRYGAMATLAGDLEGLRQAAISGPSTGLRARQRPRGRTGKFLAGAVVVALLAIAIPVVRNVWPPGATGMDLVVLPFENLGPDQSDEPFVDGLAHAATNALTAIEQFDRRISVVPARDVMLAGDLTTSAAARRFRVRWVITGEVQPAEDQIVLQLGLTDSRQGFQEMGRRLSVPRANLAVLPDSLVRGLAELLDLDLEPSTRRALTAGGTEAPDAYDLYSRGRGYLRRYENADAVDSAIVRLHEAIARDSSYPLAVAALGEAYWRRYEITADPTWVDSAIAFGRDAVALDAELPDVLVTMGMIYKGTGRYEDAEETFRAALALHPGNAFAHNQLGMTYHYLDEIDPAVRSLEKAIDQKPDYWAYYRSLGFVYAVRGLYEEAAAPYRRVTEFAPDNPAGFNDVALTYEMVGDYDEAERWYREATLADPNSTQPATAYAYGNLGGIAYRRKRFGEAVRLFEQSRQADPTNPDAWINLPNAYYWAGDTEQARRTWRNIIALDEERMGVNPNDVEALIRLAEAYAQTGRQAEARDALDRIERLPTSGWRIAFAMARIYDYLGERPTALDYLERALEAGLQRPAIEFHEVSLSDLMGDARYQELMSDHLPNR